MRRTWTLLAALAALLAGVAAHTNDSEALEPALEPALLPAATDGGEFALQAALVTPTKRFAATEIPDMGVATTIRANETHYYTLNLSYGNALYTLSLSECARTPITLPGLTLYVGGFSGTTSNGGLLEVSPRLIGSNYIMVVAPPEAAADAEWSYQLGADVGAAYAPGDEALYYVDSDFANALFVTEALDDFNSLINSTAYGSFVNISAPQASTDKFTLFLSLNTNTSFALSRSYCAVADHALLNQNNAVFSVSERLNNDSVPVERGQFLVTGLNTSTAYTISLGIPPAAGYVGGVIFQHVQFSTKQSTSCQLIYNMTNCPQTAFSVPGNASAFSRAELTSLYDEYVGAYYANFTRALDQVNCDDSQENMFSVFSTCEMCASAYKNWLCTVSVPRCEDWSNNASYLAPREVNQSRNSLINDVIQPGRYKEMLPCYWLCYNVATYCPSLMYFVCPTGADLNASYGFPSDNGDVSCSYPGAYYSLESAAVRVRPAWALLLAVLVAFL